MREIHPGLDADIGSSERQPIVRTDVRKIVINAHEVVADGSTETFFRDGKVIARIELISSQSK